jgi:hypothetical protein
VNTYTYNDALQTSGVSIALFAEDTSLYVTDRKEDFVIRKLHCGLSSMETWCERRNIIDNENKTQSRSRRPTVSSYTE